MKAIFKKIVALAAMAVLAVGSLFPAAISTSAAEASATSALSLETSRIEDDLADVNKVLYPPNPRGTHQLIRFQEYCFANSEAYEKASKLYGLYFYIYNPTKIPFREDPVFHCANMATAYNADGEPSSYENVKLTFVDRTDDHLFYKFRVADPAPFLEMAQAYANKEANAGVRRYDIVSVQLYNTSKELLEGEALAAAVTDGVAAATWKFIGFGRGCSEATENTSTLSATVDRLEVLNLKVEHTNWREGFVNDTDNTCEEINTVYFSVPQKYFENYGGLQKIKASWYEYKTTPIFVTSDTDAYIDLSKWIGVNVGEKNTELGWGVVWDERHEEVVGSRNNQYFHGKYNTTEGEILKFKSWDFKESFHDWFWSNPCRDETHKTQIVDQIDWIFLAENVKTRDDYKVPAWKVEEWMGIYTNRFPDQERLHGYAEGLFADSIDEDRLSFVQEYNSEATRGYITKEIVAQQQSLILEKNSNFWEKLIGRQPTETLSYETIEVFYQKDLEKLVGMTDLEFDSEYKTTTQTQIDGNGKEIVISPREYCIKQIKAGENAVLLRFAQTDYYASTARFEYFGNLAVSPVDGYVAQETLFMEFDIISLGFRNENGAETIIGVVHDPFNIINGLDPSAGLDPEATAQRNRIAALVTLGVLALVFVIVMILLYVYARPAYDVIMHFLGVCLKGLLKVIWFFITLPFKGIDWIFEGIDTLSRKK